MEMFSIVVPVYNVEKYLSNCLDSIINQSFKDFELIIIDDGSTDGSGQICDVYAKQDFRVRVIHKKNEGQSEARNLGIRNSKGRYIVFVDSDDWLLDSALEKVNHLIETSDSPEVVVNRFMSFYEDTQKYIECKYSFNIEKMQWMTSAQVFEMCYNMPSFWAAPWNFIINREYLQKLDLYFIKGISHEDEEWAPRVILNAEKICFNNNCFYCNRSNRVGSITQSINIKKEYDKLYIINCLIEEARKEQYDDVQKNILLSRCSSLFLGIISNLYLYKNIDKSQYKDLIYLIRNKKKVLLFSKRLNYIGVCVCVSILGVSNTSLLLNKFRRKYAN